MPIVESECAVTPETSGRADQVVQQLTGRSRADVRGLFAHGCVRLNGDAAAEPGTMVQAGDRVTVRHDTGQRYHEPPRPRANAAFRLVFEDEHLIVVDKAAALLTVPTRRGETNTLADAVSRHVGRRGRRARAIVVHRLDRGTSGLLVFARHAAALSALSRQFQQRTVGKRYEALVSGLVAEDEGRIDLPLDLDWENRPLHRVDPAGKPSLTEYCVL